MLTILKLGGELLEDAAALRTAALAVTDLASRGPLVVIHGGGRAIDAELRARGIEPRFVDGLRITDAATLDVVVAVLAGRSNTALVAALNAAGCRAVGLTGADNRIGLSRRVAAFTATDGSTVDLGLVGEPESGMPPRLLHELLKLEYVPVIASIGVTSSGELLNINADTFAGHLAAAMQADRLIVAGGTPGVLASDGSAIATLVPEEIEALIAERAAHSGMVAKLAACRIAVTSGVGDVSIVCGRDATDYTRAAGTRISAGIAV